MKNKSFAMIAAALLPVATCTVQAGSLLIVGADDPSNLSTIEAGLAGDFSTIATFDSQTGTPSQATLDSYSAVLAYDNYVPADATTLGNELATYVNGGGRLTLATYAFSSPWTMGGAIMTHGYSPFLDVGVNGIVSGNMVPVTSGEPVFNGVNPSGVTFYVNGNYANPGLDSGATLLATDGGGVDMLAVNAAGNVYGINTYPGYGGSADYFQLLDNTLQGGTSHVSTAPDGGGTLALRSSGLLALGAIRRKLS